MRRKMDEAIIGQRRIGRRRAARRKVERLQTRGGRRELADRICLAARRGQTRNPQVRRRHARILRRLEHD